ncbi:UNVERIFIED_CONTAM: hypothetical protein Sindi_0977800 [Sesamum indicum]
MELAGEPTQEPGTWMLHVDSSSNTSNGGAGILIQGLGGVEMEVAARLSFSTTNNEAEYKALILELELAYEAGAHNLEVYTNSQLVAMQIDETYETKEKSRRTKLLMQQFDKCSIRQIPRSENDRADSLSKFGALLSGIKDRKITVMGSLLKCLDDSQATYVMKEIHEGSCGDHSGARLPAQKITRQGYFWANHAERYEGVFSQMFGIPRILICNNSAQFQGKQITAWLKELKIQQNFTAVSYPQANRRTEVNRAILQHLKSRLRSKKLWNDELPGVLWAYRTTPRSATGETHFV